MAGTTIGIAILPEAIGETGEVFDDPGVSDAPPTVVAVTGVLV